MAATILARVGDGNLMKSYYIESLMHWVDNPYVLGQDNNDNLHNEWPAASKETV